jgi:hypothetical protein
MILIAWVCVRFLGCFPDAGSRLVSAFGVLVVLSPAINCAVDVVLGNKKGTLRLCYIYLCLYYT